MDTVRVLPAGRSATAGRRVEIETLQRVLAHVAAGEPQVVEIYGEAGIGKTRLLDELAALAGGHGMELVFGRAGEYERNVPFGILAEALGRLEVDERSRAVLEALTPDPAGGPGPAGPSATGCTGRCAGC